MALYVVGLMVMAVVITLPAIGHGVLVLAAYVALGQDRKDRAKRGGRQPAYPRSRRLLDAAELAAARRPRRR